MSTGKHLSVIKEALSIESLQQVLSKKPKMIHVIAHGFHDQQNKEFYIAIEDDNMMGHEVKLSQFKMKALFSNEQ